MVYPAHFNFVPAHLKKRSFTAINQKCVVAGVNNLRGGVASMGWRRTVISKNSYCNHNLCL